MNDTAHLTQTPAPAPDTITHIALEQLHESPFNARKTFLGVEELAQNIQAEGRIHQPLLVRPRVPPLFADDPTAAAGFEIVFGHRRYRAAELAGLATAPCMVRALTDAEARKAQLAENIQREDVHPIEEGEAFVELIAEHGLTAEQLAAQIGKSVSHVYARTTLTRLVPAVRARCLAGEIGAEAALLIARLRSPKLQEKALNDLSSRGISLDDGGKKSFRHARELLRERYTLTLKDALFDPSDAALLPDAGPCHTCPKRTGNAPEFHDLCAVGVTSWGAKRKGEPERCTDPDCFAAKTAAHLQHQAEALVAKGVTVVVGNKARQTIDAQGHVKGGFVALADMKGDIKTAAAKLTTVTIQNPRDGRLVKAVRVEDLAAAGVKAPEPKHRARESYTEQAARRNAENAKRRADVDAEVARRDAVFRALRVAIAAGERTQADLMMIASIALDGADWEERPLVAKLWGHQSDGDLRKNLGQMGARDLALLLMDCALISCRHGATYSRKNEDALLTTAQRYGIDVQAIYRQVDEARKAASAEAPAAPVLKKKAKGKPVPVAKAKKPKPAAAPPATSDLLDEAHP